MVVPSNGNYQEEQSCQGLHSLLFYLNPFEALVHGRISKFEIRIIENLQQKYQVSKYLYSNSLFTAENIYRSPPTSQT